MPKVKINQLIIEKLESELNKGYNQSLINAIKERINFRKNIIRSLT